LLYKFKALLCVPGIIGYNKEIVKLKKAASFETAFSISSL
jgi:hypothetical protein